MNKEKAITIQRWYNCIRLALILVFLGLIAYYTM